jgi:hypothetical protein
MFMSASTRSTRLGGAILGLLMTISGCESANRINSDFNENTNFSAYKSYGAIELGKSNTTPPTSELQTVVQQTLDNQLVVRYVPVKAGEKSDFSLRYFINELESLPRESPVSGGIGIGGGSGGNTYGGAGISLNFPLGGSDTSLRLRVVIDVIDNASGKQVWRGSRTINTSASDMATRNEDVATAVMEIIAAFPPN